MNDKEIKDSRVAAALFLLVGLIILASQFNGGINMISAILGGFLSLFGGLGIWKPEIGAYIYHYFKNFNTESTAASKRSVKQKNINSPHSPQAGAGRDVNMTINHNYGSNDTSHSEKKN